MSNAGTHGRKPSRTFVRGFFSTIVTGLGLAFFVSLAVSCGGEDLEESSVGKATQGVTTIVVLEDVRDSCLNEMEPNRNYGLSPYLSVSTGDRERTLIDFDADAIREAVFTGDIQSAMVELTLESVPYNLDSAGGTVSLYEVTEPWTEWGASWRCTDDAIPDNGVTDCEDSEWSMGGPNMPWHPTPIATAQVFNGQQGTLTFDVSDVIAAIVAGGESHGWVLIRDDESPDDESPDDDDDGNGNNGNGNNGNGNNGSGNNGNEAEELCIYGDTPDDIPASCFDLPEQLIPTSDLVFRSAQNTGGPKLTIEMRSNTAPILGTPTYLGFKYLDADNRVSQYWSTTNYGSSDYLVARNNNYDRNQSVLKVDTSDLQTLLGTNTLAKAELSLSFAPSNPSPVGSTIYVRQMLKYWAETNSNWNYAYYFSAWLNSTWNMLTGSGTYSSSWIDTTYVSTTSQALVLDITSDVQRILNGGAGGDNHGWLLKSNSSNGSWFYSRSSTFSSFRPRIKLYAVCEQDTATELCLDAGATCGQITVTDNCGDSRTVTCGSCMAPDTCDTGNTCSCEAATCAALGATCGSVQDVCGGPDIECGTCSDPQTCGGAGSANQCGCTPITCTQAGLECGEVADGCGSVLTCSNDCKAPKLGAVGNRSFNLGTTLDIQLSATSGGGDYTFYASPLPLPTNATLDATTGVFRFRPSDGQEGIYNITFGVTNGIVSDDESITITVNAPTPGTVTAFSGRLLDTNDFVANPSVVTPIVGATVSFIDTGVSATSDASGFFTMSAVPAGSQVLDIAPPTSGIAYAGFREAIHIVDGVDNIIERPFYLPRIDTASLTIVVATQVTDVTSTTTAGDVSISVAADTALGDDGLPFNGSLSISEVPEGLAPAAMPSALAPGLVITIQPVGVTFPTPVPITFPNYNLLPVGSLVDIWSIDPDEGVFAVVGVGEVQSTGLPSPNDTIINTISGGVRAADWHFILPGAPLVASDEEIYSCEEQVVMGSSTSLAAGNLRVDYRLPSYTSKGVTRGLELVYTSQQAAPEPIVSSTTSFSPTANPTLASFSVKVGGTTSDAVYTSTSLSSLPAFQTFEQAVQVDASSLESGLYPYELISTSHYRDAAPFSAVSRTESGRLMVNNQRQSAIGAGWSVGGVSRLYTSDDGVPMVIEGDGRSIEFVGPSVGPIAIEEDGWQLTRTIAIDDPQAAHLNPQDGLLYVAKNGGSATGIYRINANDSLTLVRGGTTNLSTVAIDPENGNVFYGNNGGNTSRITFGQTGSTPWLVNSGQGGHSPVGMTIVPDDYVGSVVSPGDGILVDRANESSPKTLWTFSPDTSGVETVLHNGSSPTSETLDDPRDVAVVTHAVGDSDIYVVDIARPRGSGPGRLLHVGTGGDLTEVVTSEVLGTPEGMAADLSTGDLIIMEVGAERIIRVNPVTGAVSTMFSGFDFGSTGLRWAGVDVSPDGNQVFVSNTAGNEVYTFTKTERRYGQAGDFSSLVQNPDGSWTRDFADNSKAEFNSQGLQTAATDKDGNSTVYAYDAQLRLQSIADSATKVTTFAYNGTGKLLSVTDPLGRITSFTHDSNGDLTQIDAPDASTREYRYDAQHRMTSQVSERGFSTTYIHNSFGRHVKSLWPDGSERELIPSATVALYDPMSGQGSEANPAPVIQDSAVVATYTDGEGRESIYELGVLGRAESMIGAALFETTATRDSDGHVARLELPSGHVINQTFDALGNELSSQEETKSGTTTAVYDAEFNTLSSVTAPDNSTTTYTFDDTDLTSVLTDEGRTTNYTYYADGRIEMATEPTGVISTFLYDTIANFEQLKEVRVGIFGMAAADERVTTFARSANQSSFTVTDDLGRSSVTNYDGVGLIDSVTLPDTRVVDYDYDEAGNLASLTPPGRLPHTFLYTETNQLGRYTPPPAQVGKVPVPTKWTYNAAQELEEIVRPDGRRATLTYGTSVPDTGRLKTITIPEETRTITYNAATAQVDSLGSATGTLSFEYEGEFVDVASWIYGDIIGSLSLGLDIRYRVNSFTVGASAGSEPAISYAYNDDGQTTSAGALSIFYDVTTGLATGTSLSSVGSVVDSWDYNDFAEPDHYEIAYNGGSPLYNYDLVLDDLGRIEKKTETIGGVTRVLDYGYDLAGRLETVMEGAVLVESYDFSGSVNDNRSGALGGIAATYNDQDQLLTYGSTSYTYTQNGEVSTKTVGADVTTYSYDSFGVLRSVILPSGEVVEYVIDALNRRIGKKVGVGGATPVLEQAWLYKDGLHPIAELDGNGDVQSVFVYGVWPHVPDYIVRAGGAVHRVVTDRRGSVRLIVDTATGGVLARRDYDSFGNITFASGNDDLMPFGFVGGLYDADTGLTQFGAREYDPETGRWTAKDPTLFTGGGNLYVYVANDPIDVIDANGRWGSSVTTPSGASAMAAAGMFVQASANTVTASIVVGGTAAVCDAADVGIDDLLGEAEIFWSPLRPQLIPWALTIPLALEYARRGFGCRWSGGARPHSTSDESGTRKYQCQCFCTDTSGPYSGRIPSVEWRTSRPAFSEHDACTAACRG